MISTLVLARTRRLLGGGMAQIQLHCPEACFLLQILEEKHEELLRITAIMENDLRTEEDPVNLRIMQLAQRGLELECSMIRQIIQRIREGFQMDLTLLPPSL